jgi:RNA polymerase sigma-70 factor, ECF subfamily
VSDKDAPWIDEALAGHPEAFGHLVLMHQDRLFNSVNHWVGNADDAYDICQETFIRAFLKLESFRKDSAFCTWLYRIAYNTTVSRQRQHRPMASVEQLRETSRFEPPDQGGTPADALARKERCTQVQEAIKQLEEEYRTVLVLREIDGYGYETIASILDVPVGTVRSRLHRARLQLRDRLKKMTP